MKRSLLAAAVLLTACAATGVRVTEEQVKQFEKGKSTYVEVVQKLGQPTTSVVTSQGLRYASYAYSEAAARPETFIPFVGPFVGGVDARSNAVTFIFDGRGVLQDYTSATSQFGTGMGAAAGTNPPRVDQPRKTPE